MNERVSIILFNVFLDADEKQNASERINLQHIMELREAFEAADTDQGGALEIDEVSLN